MTDDVEIILGETGSEACYIESLARTRFYLPGNLLEKLDAVIEAELELALLGAEKAKSDILKDNAKNNVTPLKGA